MLYIDFFALFNAYIRRHAGLHQIPYIKSFERERKRNESVPRNNTKGPLRLPVMRSLGHYDHDNSPRLHSSVNLLRDVQTL